MEKLVIKLNASGLKTSTCPYRFWQTCVEGYVSGAMSSKMLYGIAMHKYIDTMFKERGHMGKAREKALFSFRQPRVDDKKALHMSDEGHLIISCYNVWENWILKDSQLDTICLPDGLPATEVTFSIQGYYEDDFIRIDLEGTIDRIGKIKGGVYVVNDFKTTGRGGSAANPGYAAHAKREYLADYEMSQQLRFYVFALKLMGKLHPDSALGQIGLTNVGACIDGIFLKPKACDNEYQRSDVFQFGDLTDFQRALDDTIKKLSYVAQRLVKEGIQPTKDGLLNGSCRGEWGKCQYWNVCKSQDTAIGKVLLDRDFKKKPYDPLHHQEDL